MTNIITPENLSDMTLERRDGCLLWSEDRQILNSGYPYVIDYECKPGNVSIPAHREVAARAAGYDSHRDLPPHTYVRHLPECSSHLCLNEEHLVLRTFGDTAAA